MLSSSLASCSSGVCGAYPSALVVESSGGFALRWFRFFCRDFRSCFFADIYKSTKSKVSVSKLNQQFLMSLKWNEIVDNLRSGKGNGGGSDLRAMLNLMEQNTDLDENTVEWMHSMTLAAQAWEEAMNGPNAAEYLKVAQKEIETLTKDKDAWEVVTKEDWMNVLPSTWAFK